MHQEEDFWWTHDLQDRTRRTEVTLGCIGTSICKKEYKVLLAAARAVSLECKGAHTGKRTYVPATLRTGLSLILTDLFLDSNRLFGIKGFNVKLLYCRAALAGRWKKYKNPVPPGKDPTPRLYDSSSGSEKHYEIALFSIMFLRTKKSKFLTKKEPFPLF
ncbi:hypothetical protein ARMSODRAFT_981805 [Armillaria solidipes]|uniref:Uncharacterized protein n=1 Tax=Armillaria solidipes TaxID=1076256 RepID=A0A2H3AWH9_9AGAR|nr:hypothetical protein ARMSODRAFT_981805 [Armillaria solidipes]